MTGLSMLASFPLYTNTTPSRSLLKLRPLSMRDDYPLASKIIVKNLPYSAGETTLQKEFSNFGKIAEVKMVKDVITKRSKGYAFIQYTSQDEAMLALETMDQMDFYGRTISVEIAKLGRDNFSAPPRASGPPKKWNLPEEEDEDFYGPTISVEIVKLGRDNFSAPPRASGPQKKWNLPEQVEEVDSWY